MVLVYQKIFDWFLLLSSFNKKEKKFKGDICIYEYYYLKCLLYNNYELYICKTKEDFKNNYIKIMNIYKEDILMEDIYNNYVKQTNFSYIFYDFN